MLGYYCLLFFSVLLSVMNEAEIGKVSEAVVFETFGLKRKNHSADM